MRRLVLNLAMAAFVMARPETYREKEDFQYSRSSSDDGTKSGYYDAQRGNMGGNYERAHNMDILAQHQMGGLVRQVEGELGDASKTRSGSVLTSSNSRGVFGSGNYDLSNLQGRNFQEGMSYGDSNAASSSNSAFSNARYSSNGHLSNSDYIRQQSNLDAQNSYGTNQFLQESQVGRTSKHYTQSAYEGRNSYVQGNIDDAANSFGSNTHNRLISTVPVKVIVRPGQRIAVPIATQTHSGSHSATYIDQSIANQQALDSISHSDSLYASHADQNAIKSDAEVVRAGSHHGNFKPTSNGKHYESSYNYHKEWERHNTQPTIILPTLSQIPKNSELYDDSLTKHESQYDKRYNENLAQNSASSHSMYQSELNRQHQSASSIDSNHVAHGQEIRSNINSDAATLAANSKPHSYQSSYSYHKSWERQGDPYIIKPASNGVYEGQTAERLTDAGSSYNYDSSITNNQQGFSHKCLVPCEPRHSRVARSYNLREDQMETQDQEHLGQQIEDYGQRTQHLDSYGQQSQNVEDFGQQTQEMNSFGQQSENLQDFGQQTQQLNNFGQQSENLRDFGQQTQQLNSFGQQSENLQDFGQQTQQLNSFGQQSENLQDFGQHTQQLNSFGQQSENLQDFGQQTQQLNSFGQQSENLQDDGQQMQQLNSFGQQSENFQDFGQQTQQLNSFKQQLENSQDLGQQSQQLESLGQQSQNLEDMGQETQNLEDFSQQTQQLHSFGKKSEPSEDYGQQTQHLDNFDQQLQNTDYLKPDSTLEHKPGSSHNETGSLSNLWGKIDNLDSYYHQENVEGKESQKAYNFMYHVVNFDNSTQNFPHGKNEGPDEIESQITEKSVEKSKIHNQEIPTQNSFNKSNSQHTAVANASKTERSYLDIGRGDIGPEDQPGTIDQSAEGLLKDNDNLKQVLSGITTEQHDFNENGNDFKILKDEDHTNGTNTIINNNDKLHKNVEINQQQFSDQQVNIEQETWNFEQQNTDQRLLDGVSQQNQNIYNFGQEKVYQDFVDFSQQNEDFLHSNLNNKNNPELESFSVDPVTVQESEHYVINKYNEKTVEEHKTEDIIKKTDRKVDLYNEAYRVRGIEDIVPDMYLNNNTTEHNISTSTISPMTENRSFWNSVGMKFKNAKDKIASWF